MFAEATFILIYVLSGYQTTHAVEFKTKKACESARIHMTQKFNHRTHYIACHKQLIK